MKSLTQRIQQFHVDRQEPTLHRKYELMAADVFSFYRATCFLFYEDLALNPIINNGPLSWICGDLHLENFGSYKGDNRLVYFDLNDFDEAMLAPCHLELARIVTSIFIAFESLEIEQKKALKMARLFIKKYAAHLSQGKPNYIERQTAEGIVCEFLTSVAKITLLNDIGF